MAMTSSVKRVVTAAPVSLAVFIASMISGPGLGLITLLIAAIAGLGVWIVFPLLGRATGAAGYALDLLICFGGLIVGGLIAGTLLASPGWGTILGASAAAGLPFQSVVNAGLFLAAFAGTIYFSRR